MNRIRKLRLQLWRSKFLRSVATVASGTAAAQIITIVFSPILTRLYGPEAFGLFGTFSAVLAIMVPIATLSYPVAIILPHEESEALALTRISIFVAFATSALTLIVIMLCGSYISDLLKLEPIKHYLHFLPLAMLASGLYGVSNQVVVRRNYFKIYSSEKVANSLLQNGLKSAIGYFANTAFILITVMTTTLFISSLFLYIIIKIRSSKNELIERLKSYTISEYLIFARKHSDFPLYRTPQVVLNVASHSLPILFLAAFHGSAAAGYYTLAKMVISAPLSLLGQAFSTVFYPKINKALNSNKSIGNLIKSANIGLLLAGLIPASAGILFAPVAFSFLFGEAWATSGNIAQWMSIWMLVSLVARPSAAAIPVLGIQKFYLKFEVIGSIIRIIILYLATSLSSDLIQIVSYFVAANILIDMALIIYVYFRSKRMIIKYS